MLIIGSQSSDRKNSCSNPEKRDGLKIVSEGKCGRGSEAIQVSTPRHLSRGNVYDLKKNLMVGETSPVLNVSRFFFQKI